MKYTVIYRMISEGSVEIEAENEEEIYNKIKDLRDNGNLTYDLNKFKIYDIIYTENKNRNLFW